MNWQAIFTDPMTYILWYVVSLLVGAPVFRHAFKKAKVPKHYSGENNYAEMYARVITLLVFSPVTVPAYLIIYWFLWRCLFKPGAEYILPDYARLPEGEE